MEPIVLPVKFSQEDIVSKLETWASELGFQDIGIASLELDSDISYLKSWLDKGYHGSMAYLEQNAPKRYDPKKLIPGTLSVISIRCDYLNVDLDDSIKALEKSDIAYVSRYALGRDYHKVLRSKLKKLANSLQDHIGSLGYRVFTDSAPVLERALARNSGLGWIGKNTNLISKKDGSMFFLGEIFTDIPLEPSKVAAKNHCGTCRECIDVCPTKAIIAPYQLDANRCISYLTIESKKSIPIEFRKSIGNRIFGCDDCQLFCPWNKYAKLTAVTDFTPRHGLEKSKLTDLFLLDEDEFEKITIGSAIRRVSYPQWIRNLAIALGNAPTSPEVLQALEKRLTFPDEMVLEHVNWAILEHKKN